MKTSLILFALMTVGLFLFGQSINSTPRKVVNDLETEDTITKGKSQLHFADEHIDIESSLAESMNTDSTYSDSTGIVVTIQNSLPRGDRYTDPNGIAFGQVIFWNRVINESDTPLELTINFPAESYAIPPLPDSYLKLYLPPNEMTLDKRSMYNYGAKGLKDFLDTGLNEPTFLQITIDPNEEHLFNIGALSYKSGGTVRAGLILKGQALFYKISIMPHFESMLFPCGQIVLKK